MSNDFLDFTDIGSTKSEIEDQIGRLIQGPSAHVATIHSINYGESSGKGTPGFEILTIIPVQEGKKLKEFEVDYPAHKFLKSIEGKKIKLSNPYNTTVFYITPNTMKKDDENSVLQKMIMMAEELGVREEFDKAVSEVKGDTAKEKAKGFAEALNKVFQGKKGAFLYRVSTSRYMDDQTNAIKESSNVELYPFGKFVMNPIHYQDQVKKVSDKLNEFTDRTGGSSDVKEEPISF